MENFDGLQGYNSGAKEAYASNFDSSEEEKKATGFDVVGDETTTNVENETTEDQTNEKTETENENKGVEVNVGGRSIEVNDMSEAIKIIENMNTGAKTSTNELVMDKLGLSVEDLQLMAAIKEGDKNAIAKAMTDNKVSPEDVIATIDEGKIEYTPEEINAEALEREQFFRTTFSEQEAEVFADKVFAEGDDFANTILMSQENTLAFKRQLQTGVADEILPEARKMAAIQGISLFDAYAKVGHEKYAKNNKTKNEDDKTKKEGAQQRVTTKARGDASEGDLTPEMIRTMSSEEFEKLVGKRRI